MIANILLSLDTRRAKKDGSFPLIMRVGFNNQTIGIPTGYSFRENDWDAKTRKVKKSFEGTSSVTRLNNALQKQKTDAMDIIVKLHESGELQRMTVGDIKNRIVQKQGNDSFFAFGKKLIEELKTAKRYGTARTYHTTLNVLKGFNKDKDLPLKSLNYDFLKRFETHHLAKDGNSPNGLAVYMRTIRAIYNYAIKAGVAEKEWYPFADYTIKTVATEKRALDWELLKKIIELQLKPGDILFNARNYFVASYMMYGMNFTDMAFLKKTDMVNGRINYRRRKTSKLYDVKITPALQHIIDHYINRDKPLEYIFPILKRDSLMMQYKDIEWARKRYNKKLKFIANKCGIEGNLTSYVSRHSFATQAMLQAVPLNAISSMLGHSSLKTTEVYLKSLPSNILDDYNERVTTG